MKTSTLTRITLTLSFTALQSFASTNFVSDAKNGSISFRAIGKPAFLKIDGKGEGPQGTLKAEGKILSGELKFNLNSLNTGIDLRDEHMKDKYLKTKESPTATLKIEETELSSTFEEAKMLRGTTFKGKLTLNKTTKDVKGEWETSLDGNVNKVVAKFSIKLSEFGIEIPEYAGITVADEVKIEVNASLSPSTLAGLAR